MYCGMARQVYILQFQVEFGTPLPVVTTCYVDQAITSVPVIRIELTQSKSEVVPELRQLAVAAPLVEVLRIYRASRSGRIVT